MQSSKQPNRGGVVRHAFRLANMGKARAWARRTHGCGACLALSLALLSACAPASSPSSVTSLTDSNPASSITALAVNPSGALVCIAGGRAYRLENLKTWSALPSPTSASSAAWREGNWWLALPGAGLIYKATGVPQSISVIGSPALLTSRFAFTTSGEVLDFSGASVGRVGALPSVTLETTGTTFALVGRVVYAIDRSVERRQMLETGMDSLVSLNDELQVLPGLAARASGFTYRLEGRELTARNSAERVIAKVTIDFKVSKIIASSDWVAVTAAGSLSIYRAPDLSPVLTSSCGGGR